MPMPRLKINDLEPTPLSNAEITDAETAYRIHCAELQEIVRRGNFEPLRSGEVGQ